MEHTSDRLSRFLSISPTIIQGGMGVGVSSWKLASSVAQLGQVGVVSGTALDTVMVRELQNGDPFNRIRALREYPDQLLVSEIIDKYYVEGGIPSGKPYKLLPILKPIPTVKSQRIVCAAAFSEVFLAKEGHDGLVGINLLAKIKKYTLSTVYGAMLAGVDAIMMGAGIPIEEAQQIPKLASGEKASLRLDVDTSRGTDPKAIFKYELDPTDMVQDPKDMQPPLFFPIVASDTLARILDKKIQKGLISGWIIEGPLAGGHNAPPRGKNVDDSQNPLYDERDIANLETVANLGYPFFLAGGFGTPEKLQEALSHGAMGIQVGSLFSLTDESGYTPSVKKELILTLLASEAAVKTDGRVSSTGFPFKVLDVPGTLSDPELYTQRTRICDLGLLQNAYVDGNDRLGVSCPAEPVDTYVAKGFDEDDTVRRVCLCNGLMANIGLGQFQKNERERTIFTAGDALLNLPLGSREDPHYSAKDVVAYLLGEN